MPKRDLPDDIEPDQVWRAPDGQHYKVLVVERKRRATLQCCTLAGQVLNTTYSMTVNVDRMHADYVLVSPIA